MLKEIVNWYQQKKIFLKIKQIISNVVHKVYQVNEVDAKFMQCILEAKYLELTWQPLNCLGGKNILDLWDLK